MLNFISGMRIDHSWRNVFEIRNCIGAIKYPLIEEVVKMSLTVPHGSADVERGFSLSARILSEERASMSERTLNARLNVIHGIKLFENNRTKVPVTKGLL